MNISAINEESLLLRFEDIISEEIHKKVRFYFEELKGCIGVLSVVPSYNSLMVYFDLSETDFFQIEKAIQEMAYDPSKVSSKQRIIKIPVCYELGLDFDKVTAHTGLSEDEIVECHCSVDYLVYMVGFTPGFPYLGGMKEQLTTPRLSTPRTKIEAGSVGIGGQQTGIYPLDTPGGWNIIGKTPLKLFDKVQSKTLIKMGDFIRFVPIDTETYDQIKNLVDSDEYDVEVILC